MSLKKTVTLAFIIILPLSACDIMKSQYSRGKGYVYENVKFKKPVKEVLVKRLPESNGPMLQKVKEIVQNRQISNYQEQQYMEDAKPDINLPQYGQEPLLWRSPTEN